MPGPEPTISIPFDRSAPIEERVDALARVVDRIARAAHINIFMGLATHQIMASVPAVGDIEENQIVIGKDGATWKLYTKISGARYEVTLTAV